MTRRGDWLDRLTLPLRRLFQPDALAINIERFPLPSPEYDRVLIGVHYNQHGSQDLFEEGQYAPIIGVGVPAESMVVRRNRQSI